MPTLRSLVRFVLACATVFAMGTLPAQADDIDISRVRQQCGYGKTQCKQAS